MATMLTAAGRGGVVQERFHTGPEGVVLGQDLDSAGAPSGGEPDVVVRERESVDLAIEQGRKGFSEAIAAVSEDPGEGGGRVDGDLRRAVEEPEFAETAADLRHLDARQINGRYRLREGLAVVQHPGVDRLRGLVFGCAAEGLDHAGLLRISAGCLPRCAPSTSSAGLGTTTAKIPGRGIAFNWGFTW
jgi:hypothetical protein